MIGVVLWKNTADGSAVIWCEDQGDLAFLNNKHGVLDAQAFFDVGDVVQFDVLMQNNMRGVQNLCRADSIVRKDTSEHATRVMAGSRQGATIIPFRGNDVPALADLQPKSA